MGAWKGLSHLDGLDVLDSITVKHKERDSLLGLERGSLAKEVYLSRGLDETELGVE